MKDTHGGLRITRPAKGGSGAARLEEDAVVEQARVDLGGRLVATADDEDLGRRAAARRRLGRIDAREELAEGVEQRRVVAGAKDLHAARSLAPQRFLRV